MTNQTPLTLALQKGDFETAKALLASGESIPKDIQSYNLDQIFDSVFRAKAFAIIDAFIADKTIETDIYEYDSFDHTIFKSMINCLSDDEASITFLDAFMGKLQSINDEIKGHTLLSFALDNGANIGLIKSLIAGGCSVNFKNNADQSLLFQVVNKNMMDPQKTLDYIAILIEEGLDVNEGDIVRETPLMVAVKKNKLAPVDLLLQHGGNPNEQDKSGNTAYYFAVVQQLNLNMYNKLAEYTAPDFDLRNNEGETLLTGYLRMLYSDSQIPLLQKLIEDGADLNQTGIYYSKEKSGIDWTAEKSFAVMEVVMNSGKVELNDQDDEGNTLLHKVCAYNVNYDQEKAKDTYRKVKLLLELGADASISNTKDQTALMLASDDNLKAKTVQILLSTSAL